MNIETDTEIVVVEEDDLAQLAALQRELIDTPADLEKMRALLKVIKCDDKYHLLCAKRGGKVTGSLVGIICHDLFGQCIPFMLVENVIVSESERGSGIGKMMMDAIEKIAIGSGCQYIALISAASRTGAHSFYHCCGYASDSYRGFKKVLVRH